MPTEAETAHRKKLVENRFPGPPTMVSESPTPSAANILASVTKIKRDDPLSQQFALDMIERAGGMNASVSFVYDRLQGAKAGSNQAINAAKAFHGFLKTADEAMARDYDFSKAGTEDLQKWLIEQALERLRAELPVIAEELRAAGWTVIAPGDQEVFNQHETRKQYAKELSED